jgi:hypothetical protein
MRRMKAFGIKTSHQQGTFTSISTSEVRGRTITTYLMIHLKRTMRAP